MAGAGRAHGYLHRDDLTKARLLDGSFTFGREERLYKTGEVGRFRQDGIIEFLGGAAQSTSQESGFRVDLGEIEAVLASHPVIAEVAVIATEESDEDEVDCLRRQPGHA